MNIVCRCRKYYYTTLFLVLSSISSIYSKDTINTSLILGDDANATLISSSGSFQLGFFTPENSKNRYVGIWYNTITPRTVVWVANRDNPLYDGSGLLRVVDSGQLVLLNGTGSVIWSTNASRSVQNPVAQLLNSGNLVVRDANDDKNFLWQSFDYPTDTLLPGMKFGKNFITGHEVFLTSWKNSGNPAAGDFTYHFDPNEHPQLVIKRGSDVVFRTGPWNGVSFGWNPNYRKNNMIFTSEVVINKDEVYYVDKQLDVSAFTRSRLSENGFSQRFVWNDQTQGWITYLSRPADSCDPYGLCGAYSTCDNENAPVCGCLSKFEPKDPQGWGRGNWSSGCVRSTPLDCGKGDAFLKFSGVKLPDSQHSWYNNSMTVKECRESCSNNCSCMAYSGLKMNDDGVQSGCLRWFDKLVDITKSSPGQDIYVRIASSEVDLDGRKRRILILLTLLLVGVVLLSLSLLLLYYKKRKKLEKIACQQLNLMERHEDELPVFHLLTISKATNKFSIKNKLGEGGFGPVYKGQLEDGQEIAVKCLSRTSHQGVDEFKNELVCIQRLQHRNLVKILGWCNQRDEMMLVYEYMPNKSLDLILFDEDQRTSLDWPRRFNIINCIARGLMYLHQDSRLRVIHRDLKASNILLDSDMNPKISDFGLARIARTFRDDETGAKTNRVVGTYGYMSPEYATYGLFSVKSDVFSFGVLVLEIVTGKRNRVFSHNDHQLNLLGHVWMLYREGKLLELVDSSFRSTCNLSEVMRSIHVGLLCVQEHPDDRPSMSSVVQMLSSDGVLPESKHPGFFIGKDHVLNNETAVSSTAPSTNSMSITLLQPR